MISREDKGYGGALAFIYTGFGAGDFSEWLVNGAPIGCDGHVTGARSAGTEPPTIQVSFPPQLSHRSLSLSPPPSRHLLWLRLAEKSFSPGSPFLIVLESVINP